MMSREPLEEEPPNNHPSEDDESGKCGGVNVTIHVTLPLCENDTVVCAMNFSSSNVSTYSQCLRGVEEMTGM